MKPMSSCSPTIGKFIILDDTYIAINAADPAIDMV